MEIIDAGRYSLKGFRRGCATEIKRSGSAIGVISGIVGWRGPGYRHYIDPQEDEEACIAKLMENIDEMKDSADEEIVFQIDTNDHLGPSYGSSGMIDI